MTFPILESGLEPQQNAYHQRWYMPNWLGRHVDLYTNRIIDSCTPRVIAAVSGVLVTFGLFTALAGAVCLTIAKRPHDSNYNPNTKPIGIALASAGVALAMCGVALPFIVDKIMQYQTRRYQVIV